MCCCYCALPLVHELARMNLCGLIQHLHSKKRCHTRNSKLIVPHSHPLCSPLPPCHYRHDLHQAHPPLGHTQHNKQSCWPSRLLGLT